MFASPGPPPASHQDAPAGQEAHGRITEVRGKRLDGGAEC
jgi:hypothetical protein